MVSPVMLLSFIMLIILVWLAMLMFKMKKIQESLEDEKDRRTELEVQFDEYKMNYKELEPP